MRQSSNTVAQEGIAMGHYLHFSHLRLFHLHKTNCLSGELSEVVTELPLFVYRRGGFILPTLI
jgi:hypothetical protein